ncbi:MAG: hypothetical protein DDT25_01316 [Chloroflexi bacterium]|nr:hypothetical protein [Chloroflexota bacterium]
MNLPSYLVRSRHGVFYFRLTFREDGNIRERRWSLRTRSPSQARARALYISAALKGAKMSAGYDSRKFNVSDSQLGLLRMT